MGLNCYRHQAAYHICSYLHSSFWGTGHRKTPKSVGSWAFNSREILLCTAPSLVCMLARVLAIYRFACLLLGKQIYPAKRTHGPFRYGQHIRKRKEKGKNPEPAYLKANWQVDICFSYHIQGPSREDRPPYCSVVFSKHCLMGI